MVYGEQFEYKVLGSRFCFKEEELNPLGFEGWELVSVTVDPESAEYYAYFKRRKD